MFRGATRRIFTAPFRHRPVRWTLAAGALVGVPTYIMSQDYIYIEDAQDAHKKVPPLALHPQKGGQKNLPIVSGRFVTACCDRRPSVYLQIGHRDEVGRLGTARTCG